MPYLDFDADDYVDEVSDWALVCEVAERVSTDPAFFKSLKTKLDKIEGLGEKIVAIPDNLGTAQYFFERGDLEEAVVYLSRALKWHKLDRAKMVMT